jgi:hypothetical protein
MTEFDNTAQAWEMDPISKTDVIWIDLEHREYRLHSVILSRQSVVFSSMYEVCACNIETKASHKMDYPTEVLKVLVFVIDIRANIFL